MTTLQTNPTTNFQAKPMTNPQVKPTTNIEQVLQLSEITKQGQYVNRKNGQLLIVDAKLEQAPNIGGSLFGHFLSADPTALEYVMVSENPHLPFVETRTKVASLNLPVRF